MWGSLARGLKENLDVDAIRETIHHVADVVAPVLSDEEDGEYETDEEYEYYEEEIVEEDSQENKASLGSMLRHMMDDEEEVHHRQELKEQEERYIRPMIPDDGDDIKEEIIDFDSESNERPVDPESEKPGLPSPPQPLEVKQSTSPTVPEPHHVPGIPVPHTYKGNDSLETASVKKGHVLATEPVRATMKSQETMKAPEHASSFRPIDEPYEKRNEPIEVYTKKSIYKATVGNETNTMTDTRNGGRVMPGRPKSKSPVPPLPTPSTAPVGPQTVPSIDSKIGSNAKFDPSPPQPALPHSQSPPLPPSVANGKDSAVTTTKVHTGPSPSPPVPYRERVSNSSVDAKKKAEAVKTRVIPAVSRDEYANDAMKAVQPVPSPPPPVLNQTLPSKPVDSRDGPIQSESVAATTMEANAPLATPPKKQNTQELLKKANQVVNSKKSKDADTTTEMIKMQRQCQDLEKQLQHAELHIVELQRDAAQRMDEEEEWRETHLRQFQQEQARIVEAATEVVSQEHEGEMQEMRDLLQQECFSLKNQLEEEQLKSERQAEQFQRVLKEAETRVEAAEKEKRRIESKQQSSMSQLQQQQGHAVRMAEDKLAHTLAKLDDREEEVAKLKGAIKELKASTSEHREVAQEAEEEMDELHAENETLQHKLHAVTAERDELNKHLKLFDSQKEKMSGLQMELRMLKEARDRERAHRQNAAVDAESNQAELLAERDVAMATVRDLERQLKAVLADLEMAKSDADRITMANINLQNALEAFQSERDAEMQMVQEQREEADLATAASHAAAIEATREANETRMREVQMAADAAVRNVMTEVHDLEAKLEESRKESSNLRHSLDEAIRRLQTSQEDVIDRVLMKNILLDWLSKSGKNKRDVLTLMASVLHFTEEEKDAIHIGDHHGVTFGKVVGAVAAPLPPSAADMEHLEGDTVREKWVNFLLAEAGDDNTSHHANDEETPKTNGDAR